MPYVGDGVFWLDAVDNRVVYQRKTVFPFRVKLLRKEDVDLVTEATSRYKRIFQRNKTSRLG